MLGLNSPELYYNLGLLYLDMKDLRQAKEYADKAYGEGYPLPGLKNRLERAGVH
jgi:TPR repeat protein